MSAMDRVEFVGRWTTIGLTAMLIIALARVTQLQVAPPARLMAYVGERVTNAPQDAPRADLLDRKGRVIAATSFGQRLFLDPSRFAQPHETAVERLAEAAGIDESLILERLVPRLVENKRRAEADEAPIRYVSVGGVLEDWQAEAVRTLRMDGAHLERVPVRTVAGDVAAGIVGKVGAENVGLLGAERTFDAALQSDPGRLRYVHDARGRPLWIEAGDYQPARLGDDVRLSLDLVLQEMAVEEITRGVEEADAAGGRIVMVDPVTGEILAMADVTREVKGLRAFDARQVTDAFENGVRFRVIPPDEKRAIHPALGRNRCVEDAYEPGSTFKPFLWSAVVERGLANLDEVINTHDGRWRTPYGRPVEDVAARGEQTVAQVLINSSNIGMVQLVSRLKNDEARRAILRYGFGSRTGLGLPGESAGIVTSPKDWTHYTQTSVAMGYEVAVTPVQMARAFSVFARDGELAGAMTDVTLAAAGSGRTPSAMFHRALPPAVAMSAREAMRGVTANMDRTLERAGRIDTAPLYEMFGKSGTARVFRPDGKGYIPRQYVSSFIAGAPVERARVVVVVVIDDPGPACIRRNQHFGSWVAGPVVRRVVERALPYLGVAPSEDARAAESVAVAE